MKALFLLPRLGDSCRLAGTWPWDKRIFRYEPKDRGAPALWEGGQFDELILAEARDYVPDLIVYLALCPHYAHPLGGRPAAATFRQLRALAPVVALWGDGGCAGSRDVILQYAAEERFDANVTFDGCRDWPLKGRPRCWAALIPIAFPPGVEVKPLAERAVPVSFCGESRADNRIGLCEALRDAVGLVIYNRDRAGDDGEVRSWEDYCRCLAGSKITLNVAWCGARNVKHVKARVSEAALAGCCLLEQRGAETAKWFTPGEDYAEYEGAEEAIAVCRDLLTDPPKPQRLANGLRAKVQTRHSPATFWQKVLDECSVTVAAPSAQPATVPGRKRRKLLVLWPWAASAAAHAEATRPTDLDADVAEDTYLDGVGDDQFRNGGSEAIKAAVEKHAPDVCCVVAIVAWGDFLQGLDWARGRCRLVYWVHDAACHTAHPTLDLYRGRNTFDLVLTTDGTSDWPHRPQDSPMLYPVHPRFYAAAAVPGRQRQVRLGFAGGIAGDDSQRGKVIRPLGNEIVVRQRGVAHGPYQDYADFLLGCRAVVNTAWSGTGEWKQAKGRVVEAGLAGCCLFDTRGAPTKDWFTPGDDYLEYETCGDILAHMKQPGYDERAAALGASLRKKLLALDPHGKFWRAVMG